MSTRCTTGWPAAGAPAASSSPGTRRICFGALGTRGLDEGLRDADNLAWKLAAAWHHGPHEALLDSYQTERRAVIAARLRAADQALPVLRGGGGLRQIVPGAARSHDALLTDGHLGRGSLGAPGTYGTSPLTPRDLEAAIPVDTPPGSPVTDVRVTAEDGSFVRLRDRLGRGARSSCSSRPVRVSGSASTGCPPA